MWAEPWSPMPCPAAPISPRTASATSATPRAAGPAAPSSTRTGSVSSGGRPSSSTPRPASASTTRSGSASRARTRSPRWPAPLASTCSTPTASPSPRSTSPRPPATRPASSWGSQEHGPAAARSCSIGVRRALGAGRGCSALQDPGWGTEERRPCRPARAACSSASAGGALRNDGTFADGRHRKLHAEPVRGLGPQGPPRRRDMGGAGAGPGRRHRARRRDHGRRSSRPSARAASRSRSTGPGSTGRSASSRWSTPPAASATRRTSTRLKALREQRDAIIERTAAGHPGRAGASSGCAPSASHCRPAEVPEGEGRPAARDLRPDHGRGTRDRRRPAHSGGLRARIGAGAARKGCNGAPDRIRTCDLRLRRPTLYPLSYRRARHRSYLPHAGIDFVLVP